MELRVRLLAIATMCWLLLGCSSALRWQPDYHVVQPGETVYSIAFRYDVDQRDLMAWNGIGDAALIRPGQRLRLSPPPDAGRGRATGSPTTASSTTARRPQPPGRAIRWNWPTEGPVIAGYGATNKTKSGIQIGGKRGQPVRAASSGRVVYAGTGLAGYGHLLIIKHSDDYLSAYGHNDRLLAREGDVVATGDTIARMGEGPGRRPLLHFEIRVRGEPADPLRYLPRR